MPLSEDEQRILDQIAADFQERDPELAGELENATVWRHAWGQMKWAAALFVLGVAILVAALATASSFFLAFGGFLVMLVASLWFERNVGRLGRAGWNHYRSRGGSAGLRDYLSGRQDRLRDRFRADE
ncbi:MAG: DUF3040 domain-containing protein [Actinobacteria bacterium]|nr:DUF3040 domain-containing protein [Actinomycetota bacterium]